MTPEKFAALVSVYDLPIPWLASHVGHCSERHFRYMVRGRPGAPNMRVFDDVVLRMQRLNAALEKALR